MTTHSQRLLIRPSRRAKQESRGAILFLIPALVGLVVLTYLPMLAVFVLSFFKWKGAGAITFVAFDNYKKLFTTDPYFIDSIKATCYFSFLSVTGSMIYSLMVAMLLNRKIPARGLFRAIFYLPYILPAAAVYIGWAWLFESNFGLFNYILSKLGIDKVSFIADPKYVVPSLALVAVWLSGNLIVIFLAGLQNVPRVYMEAAEIDGANGFQRFIHVTLPTMSPIIFYNLLMSLVTNLQVVTPALALTNGGPGNASMFMTYFMYRTAFKSANFGYASAISFVFFVIIAILTGIIFASSSNWVYYEGDKR